MFLIVDLSTSSVYLMYKWSVWQSVGWKQSSETVASDNNITDKQRKPRLPHPCLSTFTRWHYCFTSWPQFVDIHQMALSFHFLAPIRWNSPGGATIPLPHPYSSTFTRWHYYSTSSPLFINIHQVALPFHFLTPVCGHSPGYALTGLIQLVSWYCPRKVNGLMPQPFTI